MKKLLILLGVVLLLFGTGATVMGAPIFSDDFNSENGGVGVLNYTAFANWTVSDGTVDLIGNGYFDFLPGNGLYVDMDGSTGNAGKMTSDPIWLEPGAYLLEFDLAGNQRNDGLEMVTVNAPASGTLFSGIYSLAEKDPFTTYSETFTVLVATNIDLVFEGAYGDNIGMLLDDVKLAQAPVPEPATMLLLGSGLIGLAAFRRRFRKG